MTMTGVMIRIVLGCVLAVFICGGGMTLFVNYVLFAGVRTYSDPAEYAAARADMVAVYGNSVAWLPISIPANATDVRFEASNNDFLQGEPYLDLYFILPPAEAAAEVSRLRGFSPTAPNSGIKSLTWFDRDEITHTDFDRSGVVEFAFGTVNWHWIYARVDPLNGDVAYFVGAN